MIWKKDSITQNPDGGQTIRYIGWGTDLVIESRRRLIPRAAGNGRWAYTSFYLIRPDGSEREYRRMGDAIQAAREEAAP